MQEITANIQPYNAHRDMAAVLELWQTTLGTVWPIDAARFQQVLAGPEPGHFVAREDGAVVGFVASLQDRMGREHVGRLVVLLVAPHAQRKGLGTALHDTVLAHLRAAGVHSVQLGSRSPRFWCGVPGNLSSALAFFRARGWDFSEVVYDLVQDLSDYATPPAIYERMRKEQVSFAVATREDIAEVLAFEQREFPNWLVYYELYAELGDYHDLLVARDGAESVVGTLIMYTSQSHPARADVIWQTLLGSNVGALGAVGVAASKQGRGIGIALVARGSDILRERGVGNCYIDWVVLTEFYARLGYRKWREYHMSWREM